MEPKEAVRSCIAQIAETGDFEAIVASLMKVMCECGIGPFFEGLEAVIDSDSGFVQSMACTHAMTLRPDTPLADKASKVLAKNLGRGDFEERLQTAFWMFWSKATKDVHVPALRKIWGKVAVEDNRRLWAVGAAYLGALPDGPNAEVRSEAMTELRTALHSDDPYSVLMAALAFRDQKLQEKLVVKLVLQACQRADRDFLPVIIGLMVRACGAPREVVQYLLRIVQEESDVSLRLAAVVALSRSPDGHRAVDKALLAAMECDDWNVISQAAAALSVRNKGLPKEVAEILIGLLDHADPNFRGTAVKLLWDAGSETIIRFYPELQDRLEKEEDDEIALAISVAIGLAGLVALPRLARGLEQCPIQCVVRYQSALFGIAMKHPIDVAELLRSKNERVRRAVAWVIGSMGPDAASAADTIVTILKSKDEDVVRDVLVAIRPLGPSALPAIKSLVRLLEHENESIRSWSKDAILGIGPVAIPDLDSMRKRATGELRTTLDAILRQLGLMTVAIPTVTTSVDGVNDEVELARFVVIGTHLSKSGPLSFLKLEKALEPRNDEMSLSASTIRRTIESLESKWSEYTDKEVVLLDRTPNAKGGITKVGRQYLRRSREFLEQIQVSRRPKE